MYQSIPPPPATESPRLTKTLLELGDILDQLNGKLQNGELLSDEDVMTLNVLQQGLKKLKLGLVLNGRLNGMQGKQIAEALNLTPGRISQMFKEAQEDKDISFDVRL